MRLMSLVTDRSASPGRFSACARNQVCQFSLGNARFGTTQSIVFARSTKTNRLGDSRHSPNVGQGIVTFEVELTIEKSVVVTSTFVTAGALSRHFRQTKTTKLLKPSNPATANTRPLDVSSRSIRK